MDPGGTTGIDGKVRPVKRKLLGLGIALLVAGCAASLRAQTTSATLAGTVRTKQNLPVPGALVECRSESTGVLRTAVTDSQGRYRIDLLSPGAWTVLVRLPNGQAGDPRSVQLRLQQTLTLDLDVGSSLTEQVTVTAPAPMVDSARTGSELRIEGEEASDLPINGRVLTDLALLDSSVRPEPPGDFYGERGSVFVVNGQSGRSNSFLVDGLDNNDLTSGTTLNAYLSQQVIKEFVVLTSQFAPEFGRASGGVMNIITQRGGNEKEAGGFLQGVASSLNQAGEFESSLPDPEGAAGSGSRLATGFHFSGPIREDKSSYFFAYEHQQSDDVTPYTGVTRDGVAGGTALSPGRDDNVFLRSDFNLPSNQFLMVRLSADDRLTSDVNVGGISTPESGFQIRETDYQLAGSLTWISSPRVMNEERFLLGTSSFDQSANSSRPGVERPSGVFGGNNLNSQMRDEDKFQFVDNLTWQTGPHTVKFGIDMTRSLTKISTRFNPNGNFLYETDHAYQPPDCGDILASDVAKYGDNPIPCPGQIGVDDNGINGIDEPGLIWTYPIVFQLIEGEPGANLKDTQIGWFTQDSWQAGRMLLLNYGLRYDLSTFHLPADARVDSFIPNGGAEVDRNNLAPRFGFTFTPSPGGRFVVRGGAGIFYDKLVLGFPAVAAITSGTRIGLTFPQGFTLEITEKDVEEKGIDAVKEELFFPEEFALRFSTGTTLDTPYTDLYSLGAEWAVGARGSFRANATRALGYHNALLKDLNPVTLIDPSGIPVHRDPAHGSIAAFVTEGRTWYSGFDLAWRWKGVQEWYSISYTISKSLDLGPDPLKGGISLPPFCAFTNPDPFVTDQCKVLSPSDSFMQEKGRSDGDRRHRLVLSGALPLPWIGLMASGVIQVASGAPFNVTTGRDENVDGITTDRPPGVGRNTGEDTPLGPVNSLRAEVGLPPVDSLHEPAFMQVDLRVWKPFNYRSRKGGGEAYLQVFNLMDRYNGGPIEGRVTSRNFGEPIGRVGPARTLELGLSLAF
jgi:carboxypeptidase family protein